MAFLDVLVSLDAESDKAPRGCPSKPEPDRSESGGFDLEGAARGRAAPRVHVGELDLRTGCRGTGNRDRSCQTSEQLTNRTQSLPGHILEKGSTSGRSIHKNTRLSTQFIGGFTPCIRKIQTENTIQLQNMPRPTFLLPRNKMLGAGTHGVMLSGGWISKGCI